MDKSCQKIRAGSYLSGDPSRHLITKCTRLAAIRMIGMQIAEATHFWTLCVRAVFWSRDGGDPHADHDHGGRRWRDDNPPPYEPPPWRKCDSRIWNIFSKPLRIRIFLLNRLCTTSTMYFT
ncbi:unnamed protein product [Cuscuta epithymum]|uniref:Uncharacterized protein n=1 Tax=Cuscuta epithymum TaxID=186058 RepID=A0AAV0EII9_9ASTE|nr:unnamed protein product [Cuscuta epithymum]